MAMERPSLSTSIILGVSGSRMQSYFFSFQWWSSSKSSAGIIIVNESALGSIEVQDGFCCDDIYRSLWCLLGDSLKLLEGYVCIGFLCASLYLFSLSLVLSDLPFNYLKKKNIFMVSNVGLIKTCFG